LVALKRVNNGNLLEDKKQPNREKMRSYMEEVLPFMELVKRVMDH
jgi:hypothetical protein